MRGYKREYENKSHKQLWAIQGEFAQAFMRITKRLKIDWIKHASPYSYRELLLGRWFSHRANRKIDTRAAVIAYFVK